MRDRSPLAVTALGVAALLVLVAAPAAGAENLERVGSEPIDEPFEHRGSGPGVSLEDDREAAGTVDVPGEATVVEFSLTWPSEDGEKATVDLCFCTGTDCPHEEAFRTFEEEPESLTFRTETPGEAASIAWEAAEPHNVPKDAHVTGEAVFLAPPDADEPTTASEASTSGSPGPGLWQAVGAVSLVAGAAALTARAGSPTRWLPPGLIGLYHRIRDDELLEHPIREAIYERIQAEPGIHFRALQRDLDAAPGNLRRHLDRLEDADLLSVHRSGGYRCYVVTGTVDPEVVEHAAVLRAKGARSLLTAALAEPGSSLTELARATGLSTSTVGYHLDKLEDAGLVDRGRDGNGLAVRSTALGRRVADELQVP